LPSLLDLTVPPPPQPERAAKPKASSAKAASGRTKRRRRKGTRQSITASSAPPLMPHPLSPACSGADSLSCAVVERTVMVETPMPPAVRVTGVAAQVGG